MTEISSEDIMQIVYDHFKETGKWYYVRELQAKYRHIGYMRKIASKIGSEYIICEEGRDGVCFLTLQGIERCSNSEIDIANFLAVIRLAASKYISNGPEKVTSQEAQKSLGFSDLEIKRLTEIIFRNPGIYSSGGHPHDRSEFHFEPHEEVVFFENTTSLKEYFDTKDKITREAAETAKLKWGRKGINNITELHDDGSVESGTSLAEKVSLHDKKLEAIIKNDLKELENVLSIGAWKAAGILAGSCLEAILLDLWKQHEDEARKRFKEKWPDRVGAHALAAEAAKTGYLSQDQKDLSSTMQRWRNLVHPAAALRSDQPGRELANALVALLELLVAEISQGNA